MQISGLYLGRVIKTKMPVSQRKEVGLAFIRFYKNCIIFIYERPALVENSHKLISAMVKRHLADLSYTENTNIIFYLATNGCKVNAKLE